LAAAVQQLPPQQAAAAQTMVALANQIHQQQVQNILGQAFNTASDRTALAAQASVFAPGQEIADETAGNRQVIVADGVNRVVNGQNVQTTRVSMPHHSGAPPEAVLSPLTAPGFVRSFAGWSPNPHAVFTGVLEPAVVRSLKELRIDNRWVFVDGKGQFGALLPVRRGTNTYPIQILDTKGVRKSFEVSFESPVNTPAQDPLLKPGKRVALLVAISDYTDPQIPDLVTPPSDIRGVGQELRRRYGFEVKELQNPTKEQFFAEMIRTAQSVYQEDQVLLYFAGHGYADQKSGAGFWLPKDAEISNVRRWITNDDVTKLLRSMPALQVLLVSDSCYSGAFVRNEKENIQIGAEDARSRRAVMAMSSGGFEPVMDGDVRSPFADAMIEAMTRSRGNRLGADFFVDVRQKVVASFPQTPRFGVISSSGYDRGADFVFQSASR
jgi:hypothetical protein